MIWISRGRGGWAIWIPIIVLIGLELSDEQLHLLPKDHHAAALIFWCCSDVVRRDSGGAWISLESWSGVLDN